MSQNSQKYTYAGVFFLKVTGQACNFIKNGAPACVFSFEFNKIFKSRNTPALESFFLKVGDQSCNFIEYRALGQVFPCEFNKTFKNTYLIK